ncbi:MAG: hypothetical protein KGH95_03765 [Thaumarchaeota archaeon]|nr:hypothetical protein [Nitrososphaerota archaeon]
MSLSPEDRGMIEKIIDAEIEKVPNYIQFARDPNVKSGMMLTSDYDFVMGQTFSSIISTFSSYYINKIQKTMTLPDQEQLQGQIQEAVNVIIKRISEIRNAIFNCG